MNKQRRKDIDAIIEKLEEIKSEIEGVYDEESEYRDNMPENMQGGEKYDAADAACDELDTAMSSIDDIISNLENARDGQ